MIELPKIEEDIVKVYEGKQKRTPCDVNRASSVGYFLPELGGCPRIGVYERTHWQEKKMWEPSTLMLFEEGNRQERHVVADLAEAGYDVIEAQSPFECKGKDGELLCRGHIDGKIEIEVDGQKMLIPIEIKSMNPNIYRGMRTFEDFHSKPWTKSYIAQIQLYMLMNDAETALFILKDKSSGKMKTIQVGLDYELAEACLKVCEIINSHVIEQTLPERVEDIDRCKDCKFNHICRPDTDFSKEIQIGEDPLFEEKLDKYISLEDAKKEADKLYKGTISPRMKASAVNGELNMVLGKYSLTGKTDKKGSFRPKIRLVGEEE